MTHIAVDESKCVGCHICELICSIYHFKVNNPKKAGIRVLARYPSDIGYEVHVCRQCEEMFCAAVCPVNAIKRINGVVIIDHEVCTSCYACVQACPYNAIFIHQEVGKPIKCDLCSGNPQCVPRCPLGALKIA